MDGRAAVRVESGVDAGASALLAAAVAYALHGLFAAAGGAAAGGSLAFALCFVGLRKVQPEEPPFRVAPIEALLTEADRIASEQQSANDHDELVLDDVLTELSSQSRVVRLFDPAAMPSAASPDASQALLDALAELRRSLN
jgi:hypothetical protein